MLDMVTRIQAAYARDMADDRPRCRPDDLPRSYEEITPEWLTAMLCAETPGAVVTGLILGPVDNGSSNRRRIRVDYNAVGKAAGLPEALFCKATHDLVNRTVLGISGGARGEAIFYRDIRPLLAIEAPVGVFARVDPETFNSLIILEDLSDRVTEFCDHRTIVTRARAESQMRLLGTTHGTAYGNARVRDAMIALPTWKKFFDNTLAFGMQSGADAGFLVAEAEIPARLYARFAEIWPATVAAVEMADHLPATLAHGDVHLKNWYVAGNGEMALSDWQCVSRGHWARDVAYTISCALSVEDRRAWERDLLALYLDAMGSAGGPMIAFEAAWRDYRRQMPVALAWWTVTLTPPEGLPDMQPEDVTRAFIHRIATATDDLGSLDL